MWRRADISKNGGNCGNKTGRDRRNKKQKGQRAPVKGHSAKLSIHLFARAENMICIHHRSCSEGEPAQRTEAYAHHCEEKQQPEKKQKQKAGREFMASHWRRPLCFNSTQGRCSPGAACFLLEFNLETSGPFKGPLQGRR